MATLLEIAYYRSNYPGNFISSLISLERKATGAGDEIVFVFPVSERPKYQEWVREFKTGRKVYFISFEGKNFSKEIVSIALDHHVDIVHTHFVSISPLRPAIKKLGKKTLFFLHLHSNPLHANHLCLRRWRNALFLPKSVRIIACSAFVGDMAKKLYLKQAITVVENAIDFNRLAAEKHKIREGGLRILMFGYDVWIKGVDTAIAGVLSMPTASITLDIVVASRYDKVNAQLKNTFGSLPKNVHLIEPVSDIRTLYQSHDAFLVASRTEGFCYSAIEAYYSGLKVICSDIPACNAIQLPNIERFRVGDERDLARSINNVSKEIGCIDNDIAEAKCIYALEKWADNIYGVLR